MHVVATLIIFLMSALGVAGQQTSNGIPATNPLSVIRDPRASESWSESRLRWQKYVIREEPQVLVLMISVSLIDVPASAELVIDHNRSLWQYQVTARDVRGIGGERTVGEYNLKKVFEKLLALPVPKTNGTSGRYIISFSHKGVWTTYVYDSEPEALKDLFKELRFGPDGENPEVVW